MIETLATVVMLGLAAARGTQLIVHDSILDGFRERLEAWHADGIRPGKSNRARTFVLDLLSCVLCTGFHLSWITVAAWYTVAGTWGEFDLLTFGLTSFAVAAVQITVNLNWDR